MGKTAGLVAVSEPVMSKLRPGDSDVVGADSIHFRH